MKRYKRKFLDDMEYVKTGLSCINEAVINIDDYYKVLLKDVIIAEKGVIEFSHSYPDLLEYLNEIFNKYLIFFRVDPRNNITSEYGITKGSCKNYSIYVYTDDKILQYCENERKAYYIFATIKKVIVHELVHRGQYLRIFINRTFEYPFDDKDDNYLNTKEEIMANARMTIEEFRFLGYDNNHILRTIQNKDVSFIESKIFSYIKQKYDATKEFNIYIKYIYQYLTDTTVNQLPVEF